MQVEIWSDIVCPWCYVGKRRFEAAVERFEHGSAVTVRWRSYQLDPRAPRIRKGSSASHLARKYGMTIDQAVAAQDRLARVGSVEGLDLRFERTRPGNTTDAHRLLHLAEARGLAGQVKESFLRAFFTEGVAIGDPREIAEVAVTAGLDRDEVLDVLGSDRYADEVGADQQRALDLGITGVPFFLVDGRFAVSGAQDSDTFVQVLERAWSKARSEVDSAARGGETCGSDGCEVPV